MSKYVPDCDRESVNLIRKVVLLGMGIAAMSSFSFNDFHEALYELEAVQNDIDHLLLNGCPDQEPEVDTCSSSFFTEGTKQ